MSEEITFDQAAQSLAEYLNNELPAAVLAVCRTAFDASWATAARVESLDAAGVTVALRDEQGRTTTDHVPFAAPAADAGELRRRLMELVDRADQPDGVARHAWARVPTPNALRYLKALCNHFNRKVAASAEDNAGNVRFPFGECEMRAEDGVLTLHVTSDSDVRFARLRHVVADHLVRFAQKEELSVDWVETEQLQVGA